jgi:hypothetical protein
MTTNTSGTTSSALWDPQGVYSDGTNLYVGDLGNNRVLAYSMPLAVSSGVAASVVVGQPSMTANQFNQGSPSVTADEINGAYSAFSTGTTLFVADTFNNRVLIYGEPLATIDAAAVYAIGQPDLVSDNPNESVPQQWDPGSVMVDPNGKVVVADTTNARVLIFNSVPATNYAQPNVIVGQPNGSYIEPGCSAGQLDYPYGVFSNGSELFVADSGNNRVLVFSPFPTSDGQAAVTVLGQNDFVSGQENQNGTTVCGANTLDNPQGVWANSAGNTIIVADSDNNRVLIYSTLNGLSNSVDSPAAVELGELGGFTQSNYGVTTTTNTSLLFPDSVFFDGTRLIVGDVGDNRVLIWNSMPTAYTAANVIVGQTSASGYSPNQGNTAPTSQTLYFGDPTVPNYYGSGVYSDGTNLYVADTYNNRILIYNGISTLPAFNAGANVVLGQGNSMATSILDYPSGLVSAQGFDEPLGLYVIPTLTPVVGGELLVADSENNRSLIFDPPTNTPTITNTPTNTPTKTPTNTVTNSPTNSPTSTITNTPSNTPTSTATNTITFTPTNTSIPPQCINNVVGNGTPGYAGDNGPVANGQLHGPSGFSYDTVGNLYIGDATNNRVRMICAQSGTYFGVVATAGDIYTVAGSSSVTGYGGDNGPATSALLNTCEGVIFDGSGNMYITDYGNNRVRKVNPSGTITTS